MADRAVLLSGEHPTLPLAELEALLAVHDPDATIEVLTPVVARITPTDGAAVDQALPRMALAHVWGRYWTHGTDLDTVAEAVQKQTDGQGSAAVVPLRTGIERLLDSQAVARTLGSALAGAGHAIDLRAPGRTLAAWIHGNTVVVAEQTGTVDRSRFELRTATDRDHFSPVTMHPRRALGLVHLARVTPGGRLYDPFCGTGGIVLEAALDGYDAWGSDLDPWMVQGTLQTLTDLADEPLPGNAFVADVGAATDLIDTVDGIVTDLPYGRASTTDREDLRSLYDRALAAFARLLSPGGRAVVGCPDPDLLPVEAHGFEQVEHHAEYVHKSLTRHYVVLRRR